MVAHHPAHARRLAVDMARALRWAGAAYLDTETTGLQGEVIDLALVSDLGCVLNTLVRPVGRVPAAATQIHGITEQMVANAPSFRQVAAQLYGAVVHAPVVIYNAEFDLGRLLHSARLAGMYNDPFLRWLTDALDGLSSDLDPRRVYPGGVYCAMQLYSLFVGVWDDARGCWKRHKLVDAAQALGVPVATQEHRAAADAHLVRRVVEAIARSR